MTAEHHRYSLKAVEGVEITNQTLYSDIPSAYLERSFFLG